MEQLFPRSPLESDMQKLTRGLQAVRVIEKWADTLEPAHVTLARVRFTEIALNCGYSMRRDVALSSLPVSTAVMDHLSEQYVAQQSFSSQRDAERAQAHYQLGATFGLARYAINASQQGNVEEVHLLEELPAILQAIGDKPHSDFTVEDEMDDPTIACMVEDFSQEMSRDLAEYPKFQASLQRAMRSGYRAACIVTRQTVSS